MRIDDKFEWGGVATRALSAELPAMKVFVVIRSFGSTVEDLMPVLHSVLHQSRKPDFLVIADADPRRLVAESEARSIVGRDLELRVISIGENVGPAGSTAAALEYVLSVAGDDDSVILMDDDIPLFRDDYVSRLAQAMVSLRKCDSRVAGVGRIGHMLDRQRGVLVRPPRDKIRGLLSVDYLATGMAPMFSIAAIRHAGGLRPEFFVGMTEVEFGVRLRRLGWNLYVLGELWRPRSDVRPNWRGVTYDVRRPAWRRYYSVRNLVVLLREDGHGRAAARASVRSILRSAFDLCARADSAEDRFRVTVKGVLDGWMRRLGKRIEPPVVLGPEQRKQASGAR